MTKESVEQKLELLRQQMQQLEKTALATSGAIQILEQMLAEEVDRTKELEG